MPDEADSAESNARSHPGFHGTLARQFRLKDWETVQSVLLAQPP